MSENDEKKCAAVFPSIHHVIHAEKTLQKEGIVVEVIPVPREVNPNCGMALLFSCASQKIVEKIIKDNGIPLVGIYTVHKNVFKSS